MLGKIFISYRRDDSAGYAGRIADHLLREFGPDCLFIDVDSIPLGKNFVKLLSEEVGRCDVLLAIIGPNWLNACDDRGKRRLENPADFVRVEIAAALQRDIPVIPVLLDGTVVPDADQLPDDLKELHVRAGTYIRHASFAGDIARLIRGLKPYIDGNQAPRMAEMIKRPQEEVEEILVLMPAMSPTMEKGDLAKWLKKEGEKVAPGDVIAEIETDKATFELEAVDEGTLGKILVPEGAQDVAVNTPIAMILAIRHHAWPK